MNKQQLIDLCYLNKQGGIAYHLERSRLAMHVLEKVLILNLPENIFPKAQRVLLDLLETWCVYNTQKDWEKAQTASNHDLVQYALKLFPQARIVGVGVVKPAATS